MLVRGCWSTAKAWDITTLKGPARRRYQLMLVMDVCSRYPIAWRIVTRASKHETVELFTEAFDYPRRFQQPPTTTPPPNGTGISLPKTG
ncbi:hypothetical protein [uncultured Tessaracoccus sp.]|uniref:hypothetical protein n=1 Tax=uncultured Tessaracoccus sp. TaxID=905023 RepID=UPI0025FCDFF2|nr:hypothetical protein [uncultured Tessaracoccus sp.]